MMSATLTSEVETLKGLFCRNPTVLKLEEAETEGEGVSQYVVKYVAQLYVVPHILTTTGAERTKSSC